MIRKLCLLLIFVAAVTAAGQTGDFAYRREIRDAAPGWARVVLPDEIYSRVSPGMADIRVVGVRADGEQFEVPYLLRQAAEFREEKAEFKVLNQVRGDAGFYITFENRSDAPVNLIDLSFDKPNFDWRVRLDGSNDQREWFRILNDYRIVGLRNNFTNYNFTTLRFPDSKYRYFRLFVPSAEDPRFVRASLVLRVSNESAVRRYEAKSFRISEDKMYRLTVIDIDLAGRVPVSSLKALVSDRIDYYRPVSVEYAAGAGAEDRPAYRRGAAGVLSSFDTDVLRFPVFVADRIRISVSNQDSPPLHFEGFELYGSPYEIVAQFPENARYYLVYSKPGAEKPQYDVVNFADRIPAGAPVLKPGDEESLGSSAPAAKPLFTSPVWVWAAILIAVAALSLFSYRMLRR